MHQSGKDVGREERVRQSREAGIQREERWQKYGKDIDHIEPLESVHDYSNYIPIGNAVQKLISWKQQGAQILYLTSRRIKKEVKDVQNVLKKHNFPDNQNLYFRQEGEDYKDVAERIVPDLLIEDDCESIGGEKEMVYPHIRLELKSKIKFIVVQEFGGLDHLPDNLQELLNY